VIVAVPAEILVTMPEIEPIVAMPVAPLLHTPPPEVSVRCSVAPRQIGSLPPMLPGEVTVTDIIAEQPKGVM